MAAHWAVTEAREALGALQTGVTLSRWRRWLPPVVTLCASLAAALSLLALLGAILLGRAGRASRENLVRGFGVVRRVLPPLMGVQIVLMAMCWVASVAFEALGIPEAADVSPDGIQLLIVAAAAAGVALWSMSRAVLALRRTIAAFTPDPLPLLGRAISEAEARGLWTVVDGLAARLGALRPDRVVLGLTGGFFVSSGPKLLRPAGVILEGRTLYIPLPFLPLLRSDELDAVIAHELGHFSGADTDWSQRFLPIYAGVARSLDAVAGGGAGRSPVTGPAFRLGLFAMDQFHHAVRHWSRLREFAADAAGAQVTSADASARALLRVGAAAPRIAEVLKAAAGAPDAAGSDLVSAVLDHACARGLDDPAAHLETGPSHPTDTHPSTYQRLLALGRPPGPALLAEAAAPPDATALSCLPVWFADPAHLCQDATADFLAAVRADRQVYRDKLAVVAAAVEPEERVLYENTRAAAVFIAAAVLFGLTGLGLLTLHVQGLFPNEQHIAAGALLTLVPVMALRAAILRRRGREPFLVLRPEAMCIAALDQPIAWDHVADLDMALNRGVLTIRVLLPPEAPFPARRPGARGVKLDGQRRIVSLQARLPRGMTAHGFADLIADYRRAVTARTWLARDMAPAPSPSLPQRIGYAPAMPDQWEPNQRLTLPPRTRGWGHQVKLLLGLVLFAAMLVGLLVYTAPDLVADWQIHADARPVADGQVVKGSCSENLVFNICDATLSVPTPTGRVTRSVNYVFTGLHLGDYTVAVVADPGRPDLPTTDMALDRLWNRTITLVIGVLLLLAMIVLPLYARVKRARRTT